MKLLAGLCQLWGLVFVLDPFLMHLFLPEANVNLRKECVGVRILNCRDADLKADVDGGTTGLSLPLPI